MIYLSLPSYRLLILRCLEYTWNGVDTVDPVNDMKFGPRVEVWSWVGHVGEWEGSIGGNNERDETNVQGDDRGQDAPSRPPGGQDCVDNDRRRGVEVRGLCPSRCRIRCSPTDSFGRAARSLAGRVPGPVSRPLVNDRPREGTGQDPQRLLSRTLGPVTRKDSDHTRTLLDSP